ncbi:Arc family DNA-binding protein [Streptoalloteichus hindustanus]|uniref:Arc-like DNA binding domain-containing protein n=1 Tax=Streptoalloteichus hindustanus TaxID=2017 RepID=A0A1M5JVT7_STRHI|nr:Arc family DNA-binding protein [Streptoalloteichus hindustanus]SHG44654.1 Arc-like DNA binding domain-containing protein [Streptoalloteichus hindustanus]
MTRTITLRLSDEVYEAVRRYAEADHQSMNSWVEGVLDAEDMRRRCAAHAAWLADSPGVVETALAFHRANQRALADVGVPTVGGPTTGGSTAEGPNAGRPNREGAE